MDRSTHVTRWRYNDPLLVWLFVCAFALHIVEEVIGGFPDWVTKIAGAPIPRPRFFMINVIALGAMTAAAWLASRRESRGWLAIGIATIAFVNAVLHLLGSLVTGSYSPGLITGVILYLPLGQLALIRAWHQTSASFFWRGVWAGIAAHALVIVVAFTLTRMGA